MGSIIIRIILQVVFISLSLTDLKLSAEAQSSTLSSPKPVSNSGGGTRGTPFGFGAKTTGGGRATPQTPRDLTQLQAWLADNVPRVILIDRLYDFTAVGSNVTERGCQPFDKCKNGAQVQLARNEVGWCSKQKKNVPATVTFHPAAVKGMKVGSHKTLLGVGSRGIIKGKGLILKSSQNVIIQNIHVTWLNPHLVWGGDAIYLEGCTNVWIDHCTFSYIGRQMIVTGGQATQSGNTGITISYNLLSGKTSWSPQCNNKHYWALLFSGANDQVTVANNCIDSTSGRSPSVASAGVPKVLLHYYNNLHTDSQGQILCVHSGGNVLAEGNVFKNAKFNSASDTQSDSGGISFVPFTDQDASKCTSALGRPCVRNLMVPTVALKYGLKIQTLSAFRSINALVSRAKILPASQILNQSGRCGVGKS